MDWRDLPSLQFEHAVINVNEYFKTPVTFKGGYSGSRFERLGNPDAHPNEITGEDILSLSLLSVSANNWAIINLLDDHERRANISSWLAKIPISLDLSNPDDTEARYQLQNRDSALYKPACISVNVRFFGLIHTTSDLLGFH